MGGWADGWDADPGPDQGECQGESPDPEAGSQEVTQPHTLQGQSVVTLFSYILAFYSWVMVRWFHFCSECVSHSHSEITDAYSELFAQTKKCYTFEANNKLVTDSSRITIDILGFSGLYTDIFAGWRVWWPLSLHPWPLAGERAHRRIVLTNVRPGDIQGGLANVRQVMKTNIFLTRAQRVAIFLL